MDVTETTSNNDTVSQDNRVQVDSKKAVVEQILEYKELLKTVLSGQTEVPEETRQLLRRELLANFEAAVHDNVLVNGQRWEDAPDDGDEAVVLENLLDDTVVELGRCRRRYPKVILHHVVRGLRAERKLMSLYEETVKPQQLVKDPCHESIMTSVSAAVPGMVKEASHVIKSIKTLQKQVEGLSQVLNMKPSQATLEIHEAVFGPCGPLEADSLSLSKASSIRQPIKRAVEQETTMNCYYEKPLSDM
ncbi:unnamed protein product [Arctogadus glacialis]